MRLEPYSEFRSLTFKHTCTCTHTYTHTDNYTSTHRYIHAHGERMRERGGEEKERVREWICIFVLFFSILFTIQSLYINILIFFLQTFFGQYYFSCTNFFVQFDFLSFWLWNLKKRNVEVTFVFLILSIFLFVCCLDNLFIWWFLSSLLFLFI